MKSNDKVGRAALVDINGTAEPDAALQEKARTRKPPSVRQREQQMKSDIDYWLQGKAPMTQDPDRLLAQALAGENPVIDSLMSKFESVLASGNWDVLSGMLDSFAGQGFRFDAEPVTNVFSGRRLAQSAAVRVLTPSCTPVQSELAIRLLELGCSANATDGDGNSVLMRACAAGDKRLARHILEHCKDVDLHKRNTAGKNAAGLAKGNSSLMTLLAKVGLTP